MKTSLTCILLILQASFPSFIQEELEDALRFLASHKNDLQEISHSWSSPRAEVLAIISPELIRHSLLQDFFETQALELAYVNFGPEVADFSIGYFQMKPSFVEALEKDISQNPILRTRFIHISTFPKQSEKAIRQTRLDRLKDFHWQLQYADAFYHIVQQRFPMTQSLEAAERVAFMASAYNLGFREAEGDIREWQCVQAFPYGKKYQGEQSTYSDLAVAFYYRLSDFF